MEYPAAASRQKRKSIATSPSAGEEGDFVQLRIVRARRKLEQASNQQLGTISEDDTQERPSLPKLGTRLSFSTSQQRRLFAAVDANNTNEVLQIINEITETSHIENVRDPVTDQNVLHYAAASEKFDIVKALINHYGRHLLSSHHLLQLSGLHGRNTALHILTEKNNIKLLGFLLDSLSTEKERLRVLGMSTAVEIQGQRPRLFPCLHLAAYYGYTDIVRLFLGHGVDVNLLNGKDDSALLWASRWGHDETVKLLLEKGADTEIKNDKGSTALYWAIRYDHPSTVKLLLQKGNANPNTQRTVGFVSPIIIASAYGLDEIVDILLQHPLTDMSIRIRGGERAIHHAAKEGCLGVLEKLVNKGADVNDQDDLGDTPLLLAVEYGHNDVAKYLIRMGANLNHRNHEGQDAWNYAMDNDNSDLLTTLVRADRKTHFTNRQPLCIAASRGKCEKLQFLLEMNIDPMSTDSEGNTFLHHAAMKNKNEIVDQFHDTISLNVQNKKGNTPLHFACLHGHAETILTLLRFKAKSDIKNEKGETALHAAAYSNDIVADSVKELIQYSIKAHSWESLNGRDYLGNNCLHIAAKFARPEVMWEFRHVRLKDKDKDGFTPLHQSVRSNEQEALDTMLNMFEETNRDAKINDQSYVTCETVLHLAVDECHGKCVKRLIDFGADISIKDIVGDTVLHRTTRAIVEDPTRTGRHLEVLEIILENIVRWWCVKKNIPLPDVDNQKDYLKYQRAAVLFMINDVCNNERLSVMDIAIKLGASDVVSRLLMFSDVTMFEDTDGTHTFDLTGLTPKTGDSTQCCCGSHRISPVKQRMALENKHSDHKESKPSGVEWLVTHTPKDNVDKILDLPPVRMIEQYYTSMVAVTFVLLMVLHVVYMSVFTYIGVRLQEKLRTESSQTSYSTFETVLLYAIVPLEPLLIVIYVTYLLIRSFIISDFGKRSRLSKKRGISKILNLIGVYAFILVCFTFAALVGGWIVLFSIRFTYQDYVLAAAVCMGWLLTIAFTRGIRMIHYFYRMLISMIVRDVSRFLVVYFFVFMSFGFAFHILFQVSEDVVNEFDTPLSTLFLTFNMLVGMDEIFTDEFETHMSAAGRQTAYIKVFYVIYIILATVILLNLLIAMMNDSYQRILRNNQVLWRIESIALGIEMETHFPATKVFARVKLMNRIERTDVCEDDLSGDRRYVSVSNRKFKDLVTHAQKQSGSRDTMLKRLDELEQRQIDMEERTLQKLGHIAELLEKSDKKRKHKKDKKKSGESVK